MTKYYFAGGLRIAGRIATPSTTASAADLLAGAPFRGIALPPGVAVGLALVLLLLLLSPGLRGESRWRVLLVPTRAFATASGWRCSLPAWRKRPSRVTSPSGTTTSITWAPPTRSPMPRGTSTARPEPPPTARSAAGMMAPATSWPPRWRSATNSPATRARRRAASSTRGPATTSPTYNTAQSIREDDTIGAVTGGLSLASTAYGLVADDSGRTTQEVVSGQPGEGGQFAAAGVSAAASSGASQSGGFWSGVGRFLGKRSANPIFRSRWISGIFPFEEDLRCPHRERETGFRS